MAKAGSTLKSSRAVPHPSTNRALRRLISEVGREPVHSMRYGRQRAHFSDSFVMLFLQIKSVYPHRAVIEYCHSSEVGFNFSRNYNFVQQKTSAWIKPFGHVPSNTSSIWHWMLPAELLCHAGGATHSQHWFHQWPPIVFCVWGGLCLSVLQMEVYLRKCNGRLCVLYTAWIGCP